MAFVCDITRVATLQITVFQSHMNVFNISTDFGMPIRADLHECGHNGDATTRGQLPVSMCLGWHIGHYAYLMDKLKKTPEGAGNALDNSSLVFMPEAGHGIQLNDGVSNFQTHSVDRMVLLVGGRAGGLAPCRRHVSYQLPWLDTSVVLCEGSARRPERRDRRLAVGARRRSVEKRLEV